MAGNLQQRSVRSAIRHTLCLNQLHVQLYGSKKVLPGGLQVGERSKTAAELAAEEQQRLQRLETQRLKRLRGRSGDDLGEGASDSEEQDVLTGLGGFAARRAKRRRKEAQGWLL